MRLTVRHRTTYRYEQPVVYAIQSLRLSPQPYEGLAVISWRVGRNGRSGGASESARSPEVEAWYKAGRSVLEFTLIGPGVGVREARQR